MRVAVTGPTGFLGRASVAALRDRGHQVFPMGRNDVQFGDSASVARFLEHTAPRAILHTAWPISAAYLTDGEASLEGIAMALELVSAARRAGVERLVVTGTCVEDVPANAWPTVPPPYARAKESVHRILDAVRGVTLVTCAHIHSPYGPFEAPYRLVPSVTRALLERRSIAVGSGTEVRDWMHIDDVASALAVILESSASGQVDICTGSTYSAAEVITAIADRLQGHELIRWGARPPSALPEVLRGDDRVLRSLGWAPRFELQSGLDDAVAWWRSEVNRDA